MLLVSLYTFEGAVQSIFFFFFYDQFNDGVSLGIFEVTTPRIRVTRDRVFSFRTHTHTHKCGYTLLGNIILRFMENVLYFKDLGI